MLVKIARKIVDGMKQGLTNGALNTAILEALTAAKLDLNDEKNTEAIRNEYIQHMWDIEDLAGPAAKPAAKSKPTKKAAKKAAKPAAKKAKKQVGEGAFKTNEAGKRVGNDGKVIVAYPKPQGRTRVMFALVLAGASNADGLAYIQKAFKGCPTTISSLGWVRSQLRNNPTRWGKKYASKDMKAVKADRDCAKLTITAKLLDKFMPVDDEDESDE